MPTSESISYWIDQLKAGDHVAVQKLWEGFFARLVRLARAKLHGAIPRAADEEDIALSAFDSFCRGAAKGRFPQLSDRDDLWRLLVTLTERKAIRLIRHEQSQKRAGDAVFDQATRADRDDSAALETGLGQIPSREPTPELAAQVADECRRLLAALDSDELRSIAVWKMEGDTTEEIAARMGRSVRTVERKLRMIRTLWEEHADQ
jgi:DNA-directed RNA polymerase specialized sigma24 family protein